MKTSISKRLHATLLQLSTVSLGLIPPLLDGDLGVINSTTGDAESGAAVVLADFNGDGINDLVIGRPGETVDGVINAGRIAGSLGTTGGWGPGPGVSLDSLGATNDAGARFGEALAVGYFNDDALPDLAIGVPGQRIAGNALAGGVVVLYGRAQASFLDTDSPDFFSQLVLSGNPELGDRFGAALAVGDFDNDGFDDLAVGSPFENLNASDAGVVHVIRGSAAGLTVVDDALLSQESNMVSSSPGTDDFFGASLVAGDFDGDQYDDLAVGVPGETIGGDADAGAVHVFAGSNTGIELADGQFWHGDVPSLGTTAEVGEEMGFALAAGDFNGDGDGDLLISRPGRDTVEDERGQVVLIFGSDGMGLDGSTAQIFGINTGEDAPFDRLGESLVVGDFNNDGYDDFAVGQPLANANGETNSGRVILYTGASFGITLTVQFFDSADFAVAAQAGAEFGTSLATGEVLGSTGGDGLLIGEPKRANGATDTGAVYWIASHHIFTSNFEQGLSRWSSVVGN